VPIHVPPVVAQRARGDLLKQVMQYGKDGQRGQREGSHPGRRDATAIDWAGSAHPANRSLDGFPIYCPSIILLLAISIFPLIWSVYLSFTRYRVTGTLAPHWVGLENYRTILTENDLYDNWHQFQVTAVIVGSAVGLEFLLGFGLALLLVRQFPDVAPSSR